MDEFSLEFMDAEISRLEDEVDDLLKQARTPSEKSEQLRHAIFTTKHKLHQWKDKKHRKLEADLLKKATTFPEEIQITNTDLAFWKIVEISHALYNQGFATETIVTAVDEAMHDRPDWTDELIAEEREKAKQWLKENSKPDSTDK